MSTGGTTGSGASKSGRGASGPSAWCNCAEALQCFIIVRTAGRKQVSYACRVCGCRNIMYHGTHPKIRTWWQDNAVVAEMW